MIAYLISNKGPNFTSDKTDMASEYERRDGETLPQYLVNSKKVI